MKELITEKIKGLLTPEDLAIFETAMSKLVSDSVALRETELKAEYDQLSESYCAKRIAEDTEKVKSTLIEEYDLKLENLEQKVVARLTSFIDHLITEQISDKAIEKIAISEVASPIVEKIRKIYAESFITLDTDGSTQIKESEKRLKALETQLSEAISNKMELQDKLDQTASYLLISEKTSGLMESQKERVVKMFKGKKFSDVSGQIDNFIGVIKESRTFPKTEKKTIDAVLDESDCIVPEKKVIEENDSSLVGAASRFLEE
jgi:hypothetical protein